MFWPRKYQGIGDICRNYSVHCELALVHKVNAINGKTFTLTEVLTPFSTKTGCSGINVFQWVDAQVINPGSAAAILFPYETYRRIIHIVVSAWSRWTACSTCPLHQIIKRCVYCCYLLNSTLRNYRCGDRRDCPSNKDIRF